MNNMPAYCIGMADSFEGPIEDPEWLAIPRTTIPGDADLARRLIERVLEDVDVAIRGGMEVRPRDHGSAAFLTPRYDLPVIPANINCQGPPLTPVHRSYTFGQRCGMPATRAGADRPDRHRRHLALAGNAGFGKINEEWDRRVLDRLVANDRDALLSYDDTETYRDGGQGGFEIRTFIAVAGAVGEEKGEIWHYDPLPAFAVGCTVGVMAIA